jgi:hypothetical protein
VCQSHISRLTGLWFLPYQPKGWILMNEYVVYALCTDWTPTPLCPAISRERPLKHLPEIKCASTRFLQLRLPSSGVPEGSQGISTIFIDQTANLPHLQESTHYASIKIINSLPLSLTSLRNEKTQFNLAWLNTHPFKFLTNFNCWKWLVI